jgi:general transcription factor IIIA
MQLQKKALAIHISVTHLGRRDYVCPHENCKQAYGYKHLLERHLAKVHVSVAPDSGISTDSSSEDDDTTEAVDANSSGRLNAKSKPFESLDIDTLTGQLYAKRTHASVVDSKALRCPYPGVDELADALANEQEISMGPRCQYAFSRAYDLRRHLKAVHNIDSSKERVDEWVKDRKKEGCHMGGVMGLFK